MSSGFKHVVANGRISFFFKQLLYCMVYLPPFLHPFWASLVAQTVKYLPAMLETGVQFLGQKRSSGEGNDYSLQYSCLENSVDRGAWWATVHEVAKSWTRLSD